MGTGFRDLFQFINGLFQHLALTEHAPEYVRIPPNSLLHQDQHPNRDKQQLCVQMFPLSWNQGRDKTQDALQTAQGKGQALQSDILHLEAPQQAEEGARVRYDDVSRALY